MLARSALPRPPRLLADLRTAVTMPRVDVVASRGEPAEDEILRFLRRPHPRYRIVGNKVVGAALLRLDEFDDVEGYLAPLRSARKRARRASRLGYAVASFDPNDRRSELLAIHTSLPERQGHPIDPSYLDAAAVYETGTHVEYIGVLRDDALVAYSELRYAGEIVGMNRVMGHGDHLADNVMFLLMAGIVEHVKSAHPETRYVFYDMFFGAGEGLRGFKTRLGFRPHYVHWKRDPRHPGETADA
jgi:hypothetical protein